MKPMRWQVLILGLAVCLCARVQAADIFDIFDIKPATNAPTNAKVRIFLFIRRVMLAQDQPAPRASPAPDKR